MVCQLMLIGNDTQARRDEILADLFNCPVQFLGLVYTGDFSNVPTIGIGLIHFGSVS